MTRKCIPKQVRQKVYDKYGGHCAYCGCELDTKSMQVDHVDAVYRAEYEGGEVDNSIDNLMPACRQCNFYKGTSTIEELREKLRIFERHYFPDNFNSRLAFRYGMIDYREWDGKFYFERIRNAK